MTLAILQRTARGVYACADMKMIWNPNVSQPGNIASWRPKVIILRPDVVLAWAGELAFAQSALQEVWPCVQTASSQEIGRIIFDHHIQSRRSGRPADFMIADLSGYARRISEGKSLPVEQDEVAYIGDEGLFTDFSRAPANLTSLAENNNLTLRICRLGDPDEECTENAAVSISNRMMNISELYHTHARLGHVTTPVTGIPGKGFRYNMHLLIDTPYIPPNIGAGPTPVHLGSLDMGSYSYQVMAEEMDGRQVVLYENLYSKKRYAFEDFSEGVPKPA